MRILTMCSKMFGKVSKRVVFVAFCVTAAFMLTCANPADYAKGLAPDAGFQFRTGINYGSFTDSRDGKTYRTVVMPDGKTWMAENLNFQTGNSWCYGNNSFNCDVYGRLYDWSAAMDLSSSCNSGTCSNLIQSPHKGVCPSGWHLPSREEWTQLENAVGGSSYAGRKLRSRDGWERGIRGTDDYGFSALPGGDRWSDGSFSAVGYYGFWWTAAEYDAMGAYGRGMNYRSEDVYSYWDDKSDGVSVRCVRD